MRIKLAEFDINLYEVFIYNQARRRDLEYSG